MSQVHDFYLTSDKGLMSLDEIEERSLKYVRNARLGLNVEITLPQLKLWLMNDCKLFELPTDELLMRWLSKWTPTYLAQWSFENDSKPEDN